MSKSIESINARILAGDAVVLTAEEFKEMDKRPEELAEEVDVVTTATFGAMCSSGMFINFGHANPPIRMEEVLLNEVPVYAGIAAVDAYIGATSEHPHNPAYGGAHVIEALIAGEEVELYARGKGTDCYPAKEVEALISKDTVNEMYLFNPRNAYQNYCAATNSSKKLLHTYMGSLLPGGQNIHYSTSGELSPLINDPWLEVVGPGSRIWLGGTAGSIAWQGTQFCTGRRRNTAGIPLSNAASLALIGDARAMDSRFVRAAYFQGYGVSLYVGIGIPIPVLDARVAAALQIRNKDIQTTVADYGKEGHPALLTVSYEELQSGSLTINKRRVKTAPLSSLPMAREIAALLKKAVAEEKFCLQARHETFPKTKTLNPLNTR